MSLINQVKKFPEVLQVYNEVCGHHMWALCQKMNACKYQDQFVAGSFQSMKFWLYWSLVYVVTNLVL